MGKKGGGMAAQGIEVEILFYRAAVKKIGTESPVSGASRRKCAQKRRTKIPMPLSWLSAYRA
jgi:hypothetical protein